ncbi:MAG: penicillin-binding protein, partial [Erysipelothrix sp.]|nr:penicillin-binding protein [Erysipelothrix sp.]
MNKKIRKPKRKITFGHGVTIISIITSALLVIALLGGAVATLIVTDILEHTPKLNAQDFVNPDSTKIYDSEGTVIADIGRHLRENVSYEELPQTVIDAFISVEDSRFFVHNGFDLPRFVKAFITNIKTGRFAEGGSTFTMQLIKDTYYVSEEEATPRTIDRKFQEINLALQLEKQMSKKRILEMYINNVYFGAPNSLGIQTASRYYFGKDVGDLNLSEAAYLAGVINAPSLYNAYNNIEGATKRRNTVLNMLLRHGYITKTEHELAQNIKLEDLLVGTAHEYGDVRPYQAYIDAVISETIEITGKDPYLHPMNIYTHMNMEMQETMDAISNDELVGFQDDIMQMAAISVDHRTGAIIGISGGRNYTGQRVLNRALGTFKQPASAIKPVLSYALAFEYLGVATSHVIRDEPITYRGSNIVLKNSGGGYLGDIPFKTAFGLSRNIPAVKLLQDVVDTVGVKRVREY